MRLTPLLFLAFVACTGDTDKDTGAPADTDTGEDTGTDTDTGNDTDTGDDTDTDTAVEPTLTDARDAMQRDAEGCQDVEGTPAAGAARYFWGEYTGDIAEGWEGTEAVYVFANDTWKASGGADCVAYWVTTGDFGSTGACPTCDIGVAVTATYDVVNSTCPEDMWGEDFADTYAIDRKSDGMTDWYYSESGTLFGAGYWKNDLGMNFLSERACVWF